MTFCWLLLLLLVEIDINCTFHIAICRLQQFCGPPFVDRRAADHLESRHGGRIYATRRRRGHGGEQAKLINSKSPFLSLVNQAWIFLISIVLQQPTQVQTWFHTSDTS